MVRHDLPAGAGLHFAHMEPNRASELFIRLVQNRSKDIPQFRGLLFQFKLVRSCFCKLEFQIVDVSPVFLQCQTQLKDLSAGTVRFQAAKQFS